jgi:transposase
MYEGGYSLDTVKGVPSRKTDVRDSEWLLDLMQHGLVRGSCIPPAPIRALRDLTRYRAALVAERAAAASRRQKALEGANLKLAAVVSDVTGVSGRAMLAAIASGASDPAILAELARGRLRTKRAALAQALSGGVRPHHRFLLTELLAQIDAVEETIARFDEQIAQACLANDEVAVVELLATIPGIGQGTAELLVAEVGTGMSKFPTPDHLAAWAGLAPGNHESAGRQRSGRTRKGNTWLRTALVAAAQSAARTKRSYLGAQYRRIAARRGAKRAILAVAHSMLIIAYHIIARREPYRELGADYFDRQRPAATANRLVRRLRQRGYDVTMTATPEPTPAAAVLIGAT